MANEIQLSISLSCTNGGYSDRFDKTINITQGAIGANGGVHTVTTSAANIPLGDVSTPGVAVFVNLDATATIHYGLNDTGTIKDSFSLLPGEMAVQRIKSGVNVMAKSSAGSPQLRFWILSN